MFYNDETELLSLMLNKDEFLQYITQHYNDNCCTLLEPLIWAIHFNVPKHQRLPLLENILLQNITRTRMNYSFLPEKQILGKAYKDLGIPTVCGKPDKCFLNEYKKYKSYYPIKYSKEIKTALNNVHASFDRSILGSNYRHRSDIPFQANQDILSSTPINEKIPSLMINPLLSPINIPIDDEYSILWTDSFLKRNLSNIQNNNESKQISNTLRTLSINNNIDSHQTLENIDIAKMEYSNNTQDEMYFISRDPKYAQVENESLQTGMSNLSCTRNKEYLTDKTKVNDNNITSEYFNNLKKEKRRKRKCTKQNLRKKLQNNYKRSSKYLKNNLSIKSNKSPSNNIKMRKVITIEHNTQKSYFESRANESWTRIKQAFSSQSFSDLDKTTQTPITKKSSLWINKHCNRIEQDSIKLNYNTQENNLDNYKMDVESQNYNSWENSNFSENFSLEVSYSVKTSNVNESNKYNTSNTSQSNSQIFIEDSISSLNLTNSSQQLDSIKQDFMKSSTDSSDDNNYENYENDNEMPKLFNNIQFVETPYSILDNDIALVNELNN